MAPEAMATMNLTMNLTMNRIINHIMRSPPLPPHTATATRPEASVTANTTLDT